MFLSFELRPRNRKDVSVPSGKNIASSVRRCLGCLDKPINKPKARCLTKRDGAGSVGHTVNHPIFDNLYKIS